ncbi:MAG: glycosyltransferase family 2 protein [Crocinitomicaceae bacterium]
MGKFLDCLDGLNDLSLKLSIIMPVKDTAPYLEACLSSIVAQTFADWELIAVNDQSSDNSLEILESFAAIDTRIKVFTNPAAGLLEALRFGHNQTTGELIHRMDSDDKMPSYKLQLMVEAWQKNGKGSLITGGTEYFKDTGEVGDGFKRYDAWLREVARKQSHATEMYKECVIPSNCWLLHREDFDRVGGFEPETFPEDYDLCFRFITSGLNIIGLDEVLHLWRDREDRISRNWEVYRDNRFYKLKVDYFFKHSRKRERPLVLWGAGKNGKDLAKFVLLREKTFTWISNNDKKIGKDIYGIVLDDVNVLKSIENPQIMLAVASPEDQKEIACLMNEMSLEEGNHFWFFA